MDFVTGLLNLNGFDSVWVIINHLTKLQHFTPYSTTIGAEGLAYHGMDQITALLVLMHIYALVLMHAYPSAYAYWVDYVLFTLPPDYAYLTLLMVSYGCLRCLCMLMYVCLFAYGL
jgi:hypothetical protein